MKTLIIRYVSWGGNIADRRHRWEAAFDGETDVYDWGSKRQHIEEAKRNGWKYRVIRTHKDGTTSVIESN